MIEHAEESCYLPYREKILKNAGFTDSININFDGLLETSETDKTDLKNSFIQKVKLSEVELQRQLLRASCGALQHKHFLYIIKKILTHAKTHLHLHQPMLASLRTIL